MKALIIDESCQNGYLIEEFLLNQNITDTLVFHHANKIEAAIELARTHHFHLIIIDPAFSREFGLPLIKTIKDFSPSTTIIALSLCSTTPCTPTCREQCSNQGADWHLDKATQFDLLPAIVRKCLSPALFEPDNFVRPGRTLPKVLRETFNDHRSLKTPSFLRSKRSIHAH